MKQTLQSIKVDVVDQEVAAINTMTSDQASDSEHNYELSAPPSSGVKPKLVANSPPTFERKGSEAEMLVGEREPGRVLVAPQPIVLANHEGPLDSNRSIEASPIQNFMSNSFIEMKKPQN